MGKVVAQGPFRPTETGTSSTMRKLLAVKYILLSIEKHLQHEAVLWYTDSWNVSRILQVGSRKDHIQELALEILHLRITRDIKIIPCWILRDEKWPRGRDFQIYRHGRLFYRPRNFSSTIDLATIDLATDSQIQ